MAKRNHKPVAVILYNDTINSTATIINCLHNIALMNIHQSTQCAMIVHNTGEYQIKTGRYDEMSELAYSLDEAGLHVKLKYI